MAVSNIMSLGSLGSWFSGHAVQIPLMNKLRTTREFHWSSTPASTDLVWHDCFDGFKCSKLQVPANWLEPEAGNATFDIAVIKVPATVPVTDPTYGGPVILNPGGPGGSGVDQVLKKGRSIRTLLSAGPDADLSTAKNFDIFGFDPRGVNNTEPFFACQPNALERALFDLENEAIGLLDTSEASFDAHWTRQRIVAESCSKRIIDAGFGEYMTTADVARDIAHIFEKHGQWRQKETERLLTESLAQPPDDADVVRERLQYNPSKEAIRYWGFSYGTVLGATLAALVPDRIDTLVLDGVVDSHNYMKTPFVTTSLQDTDLLLVKLVDYCYQAGAERCLVYHADGPAVILSEITKITSSLQSDPIGVAPSSTSAADTITSSDLSHAILQLLYTPLRDFSRLATLLAELRDRNTTTALAIKTSDRYNVAAGLPPHCNASTAYSRLCFPNGDAGISTTTAGILCGDAPSVLNTTKAEFKAFLASLKSTSRAIGSAWSFLALPCTAWHARGRNRYTGDFQAATANPILIINTVIDPVTPLHNAFRMAEDFPGSVVLTQDSEGHCSYSTPSMCTARAVRKYFQTGELPKKGTVCAVDRVPFDGFWDEEKPALPEGETDEAMWRALVAITKAS